VVDGRRGHNRHEHIHVLGNPGGETTHAATHVSVGDGITRTSQAGTMS
jgi:hypothetical protein